MWWIGGLGVNTRTTAATAVVATARARSAAAQLLRSAHGGFEQRDYSECPSCTRRADMHTAVPRPERGEL